MKTKYKKENEPMNEKVRNKLSPLNLLIELVNKLESVNEDTMSEEEKKKMIHKTAEQSKKSINEILKIVDDFSEKYESKS
jgi:hypothetical protein